jgi:cation:H+ antiporter
MELAITILISIATLVAIVWACQLFTNGIEWAGHRFHLSDGAVGSVLAAVGTALPETIVPIIALIAGHTSANVSHETGEAIGVGAILGAPFLLSTLGIFVMGVAAIYYGKIRKTRPFTLHFKTDYLRRDLFFFFMAYGSVLAASVLKNPLINHILAFALLIWYGVYVWRILQIQKEPSDAHLDMDPLVFDPKFLEPRTSLILLQILVSLAAIIFLAHVFVEQIHHFSTIFQLPALLVSLIITPIATEMPEKFNSFTWIGREKDTLALGNMTGAMVFQSTIPASVGLLFTPWIIDHHGFLSFGICFLAAFILYFFANRFGERNTPYVCLVSGLLYAIFLGYALVEVFSGQVP